MPLLVADSRSTFTANDTVGGWDESTTSYYDGIEFGGREGLGFVGFDVDIETLHNWEIDIAIPLDVTGIHFGAWLRITNGGALDTKANGGIRLCLRDGAGNESYFFVGGIDTYAGGWVYFVADMSGVPDANNGANAVITNAVDFGVGGKLLAKSADDNFQMDLMHYGTDGITVSGSADTATYGTNNSFAELYDIVNDNNYGLIAKQAGSYVLKGSIVFDTTSFSDSDSIIFFEDLPVSDTFYKLSLATTTANNISFLGLINKTEGITACELDFSANVNNFTYEASTALTQGLTTFKAGDYYGDKFVQCAGIQANAGANLDAFVSDKSGLITLLTTATLTNSTVTESTGGTSATCEDLVRVDGTVFTSDGNNHATELTGVAGSYAWSSTLIGYDVGTTGSGVQVTGVAITGNEAIHITATTGTFEISVTSTGTVPSVSTAGAIVNVTAGLLPITITVKDRVTGLAIQNANVSMQRKDTKATIIKGTTDASGVYSESVSASFNLVDYIVWARQSDLIGDDYVSQTQTGTINTSGASVNFNLELQD